MEFLGVLLFLFYLLKIIFHYLVLYDKKVLIDKNKEEPEFIDELISPSQRKIYFWIFISSIMIPIFSKTVEKKKIFKVLANFSVLSFYTVLFILIKVA